MAERSRIGWLAAALLAVPLALGVPAAAQHGGAPTVRDFLSHYADTQKQRDRQKLVTAATWIAVTIGDAAGRYKQQLVDAEKAGRPPRSCAKGSTDKITGADVAAYMAALPAAEQAGPFDTAFFTFLDKRHPCPVV